MRAAGARFQAWTKRSSAPSKLVAGVGRRAAAASVPCHRRDADIFDAHLHLGHDIDGMVGDYDELVRVMDRYGISRAFMFCMDEPDRHPASAPRTTARSSTPSAPTAG